MKTSILFFVLFIFFQSAYGQINDHCYSASVLETGSICLSTNYSSVNATAEPNSIAPDPSCGSYAGGDVWFKFALPLTGGLRLEISSLQGTIPPSFTLYSGSCGNFAEVLCATNTRRKTIYAPAMSGDTLYLRVYPYFGNFGKEFSLCVFEPEIPSNDHCENAFELAVGQSCSLDTVSNVYATAQPNTIAPDPPCGYYRGGDIWFKTVMPASGILNVYKNVISGATHPPMTVYTGSCGNFTEVFCNANDRTATLNNPSLAGQTLYLRLFSYSNEEGTVFSFCLFDQPPPENDDCEDAFSIAVGDSCTFTSYSNVLATAQPPATAPNPSCGAYQGADVWFKTVMPASGALRVETNTLSSAIPTSVTFYTGTCGNFEEVACMDIEKRKSLFNPMLANEALYMRVYTYGGKEGRPFSLCVYEPNCSPDTVDAGVILICKGEFYSIGNQTITEPGEYSWVFENSAGCDSLVSLRVEIKEVGTEVSLEGLTLTAQTSGASYQWIDCANGNLPVAGATSQTFTAYSEGDFAVIVTKNSFTDTSDCKTIRVLSLTDKVKNGFTLFPNPVGQSLNLELYNYPYEHLTCELTDVHGRVIKIIDFQGDSIATLDVSILPAGVYLVRIYSGEIGDVVKIIKE